MFFFIFCGFQIAWKFSTINSSFVLNNSIVINKTDSSSEGLYYCYVKGYLKYAVGRLIVTCGSRDTNCSSEADYESNSASNDRSKLSGSDLENEIGNSESNFYQFLLESARVRHLVVMQANECGSDSLLVCRKNLKKAGY